MKRNKIIMLSILIPFLSIATLIGCLAGGGIFDFVKNKQDVEAYDPITYYYTGYVDSEGSGNYAQSDLGGYVNYYVGNSDPTSYPNRMKTSQSVDLPYTPSYMYFQVITNNGYRLIGYKMSTGSAPSGNITTGNPSRQTLAYYYLTGYLELYWRKEQPNVILDFNIYTQNANGTFEKSISGGTTNFWYRDNSYHDHTTSLTSSTQHIEAAAARGYGYSISATANSGYKVLSISDTGSNAMYDGQPVNKTINIYFGLEKYWTSQSSSFGGGDGSTADKAIIIETPQQLAKLALDVNLGESYAGKYFKQTADINLGGLEWTPIGKDDSHTFNGRFDGKGYTISGVVVNSGDAGLFGYLSRANISNVNLKNSVISTSSIYAGGIVAYATNSTTLSNCSSNAIIQSAGTYAGGIIGYATSSTTLSNCSFSGNISGSVFKVGGIAGYQHGALTNCVNIGNIESTASYSYIGGLVGYHDYGNISNCLSNATIKGNTTSAGGIGSLIGYVSSMATISNCSGYGMIYTNQKTNIGGIVGSISQTGAPRTFTNCTFVGYSNQDIKMYIGDPQGSYYINACYSQVNDKKEYILGSGSFSNYTIVENMNNNLPMQNALYSVADGGQTSEYIIGELEKLGFTQSNN